MEITIISAFFDINRKDWYGFNRSRTEYLQYFKFWARIKNKLVIFTDYNIEIEILNNASIIFPSCINHEVSELTMKEEDLNNLNGRICMTQFIGLKI